MPNPEPIDVTVEEDVKFGVFANAFRVVEEAGPDCFLDFLVYSAAENEARVVARVRVRRDFLKGLQDQMGDAILTFSGEGAVEGKESGSAAKIAYRKAKEPLH